MYPHREVGLILLILGILLLVVAVLIGGVCGPTSGGSAFYPGAMYCQYPYAAGAALLGVLAFVLLVVGLVLISMRNPATLPPPPFYPMAWPMAAPPSPPPPPAPLLACRACGRIYPMGLHAFCPSCGAKLGA